MLRIRIRDPVLLDPRIQIRDPGYSTFFLDPGSKNHISESFVIIFGLKIPKLCLSKYTQISSVQVQKIKKFTILATLYLGFSYPGSYMGKNQDPG